MTSWPAWSTEWVQDSLSYRVRTWTCTVVKKKEGELQLGELSHHPKALTSEHCGPPQASLAVMDQPLSQGVSVHL